MAVLKAPSILREKGYATMSKSTVLPFALPSEFSLDPLTEVIQAGAKELLRTAVQAEVSAFIAEHAHLLDKEGHQRLVRHGFLPEREMMTGIGAVPVQVPRVRDRGSNADGSKIRFRSSLVPPYLRKAKSVQELLPWLYLKGISTGDFSEALAALLGPDAEGLSSSTITRLKASWWEDYEASAQSPQLQSAVCKFPPGLRKRGSVRPSTY